jgi:hypothetical protein
VWVLLVINVSKYLNLTDSTNVGSETLIVINKASVNRASQGDKSLFTV